MNIHCANGFETSFITMSLELMGKRAATQTCIRDGIPLDEETSRQSKRNTGKV